MAERVQAGDYSMSDLRGSTFTVSNLGPLGSGSLTPVVNPPEIGIHGVNLLRVRPALVDSEVANRWTLTVDLSFDHRVIDSADAARSVETLATVAFEFVG